MAELASRQFTSSVIRSSLESIAACIFSAQEIDTTREKEHMVRHFVENR
jgi:hypothetical protein